MFTGLIECTGRVRSLRRRGRGALLEIDSEWPDDEVPAAGDSIAVDGCCLTAVDPHGGGFVAELSSETLARTRFGRLRPGDRLNLERSLKVGDRLGGHLVQGHVDGLATVLALRPEGSFARLEVGYDRRHDREVVEKGSVSLDGVSLTVAARASGWLSVALVPATLDLTTLGHRRRGDTIHLETDILGKYVSQALGTMGGSSVTEILADWT